MVSDLTTVANVKAWLNITVSSDDAIFARLISSCSLYIQNVINRTIASTDYTETIDGKNTAAITCKNYPVTAVSGVTIDGMNIPQAVNATACGYVFSDTNLMLRGYKFSKGLQNVVVTYTAGFAAVPLDIEQVCIQMVCLRFKERGRIGEVSKSIAGEIITFSQKDMSADMQTILNDYKRVVPV